MSETGKYRPLTTPYCIGNGVDIGSQGDPVVPWAISMDLPANQYLIYSSNNAADTGIQWHGDGRALPFKDNTLDFVYSSHLLEDFLEWGPILQEWTRVLKPGGHLIILVPDKLRWGEAILQGQPPNCAHTHESYPGEISEQILKAGCKYAVIRDSLTLVTPEDYSILFIGLKQD